MIGYVILAGAASLNATLFAAHGNPWNLGLALFAGFLAFAAMRVET